MKSTLAITAVIFTIGVVTLPMVWGDSDFSWREMKNTNIDRRMLLR